MDGVFLKLVNMSISASWVVLAVLVLRLVLKKAPKWFGCLLWILVAVRLVCPVSFESAFSLVFVDGAKEMAEDVLDDYVGSSHTYWDTTQEYEAAVNAGIQPIHGGEGHYYVVTGETPTTEVSVAGDYMAPVWAAGMAGLLVYALISYWRLRKKVAASVTVSGNVYLCDYIDTPFILGILKPKIYLPSVMDGNSVAYVLDHERAHLQRKDHWWKPLGFLLLAIHWFNPVIWLAYVCLCRDIELACDEKVIREMGADDKKAYSQALLECSLPRRMIAACPLAFGEVGVKERVKTVLNYKKPTFWIMLIAVIALILAAVCFLTDPVEPDPIQQCVDAMVGLQNADSIYAKSYSLDDPAVVNYHFRSDKGSIFQYVMPKDGGTTSVEMMEYEGQQFMRQKYFFEDSAMDADSLWQSEFWMTFESVAPSFMGIDWENLEFIHVDTQQVNGEEVICLRCPQEGKLFWFYFADGKLVSYDQKDDVDEPEVQTHRTDLVYSGSVSEYMDAAYAEACEQAAVKGYIQYIVGEYLRGRGYPYADISEQDMTLLEAINWDAMEYTGCISGGVMEDYVFTVYEPTIIDGRREDYYRLIFETELNGVLVGFTKSGPERMAEDDLANIHEKLQSDYTDIAKQIDSLHDAVDNSADDE